MEKEQVRNQHLRPLYITLAQGRTADRVGQGSGGHGARGETDPKCAHASCFIPRFTAQQMARQQIPMPSTGRGHLDRALIDRLCFPSLPSRGRLSNAMCSLRGQACLPLSHRALNCPHTHICRRECAAITPQLLGMECHHRRAWPGARCLFWVRAAPRNRNHNRTLARHAGMLGAPSDRRKKGDSPGRDAAFPRI